MSLRCVVTGGTGALGRALTLHLLGRGDRVAVPYRNPASFDALGPNPLLWGAPCSLDRPEEVAAFMEKAAVQMGGLDALACIAGGYAGSGPFEATPPGEWEDMIRQNLETARLSCYAALPHLLKAGGSVVTVAARAAMEGGSGAAAYAVSKAGVMALTRVLALENRDRGVRFNCVLPGTIDTQANRRAMGESKAARWTSPNEIARTIASLLSPESSAVTGAFVPVDRPSGPSPA